MSLRRQLGPTYEDYPAKLVADYLGDKLFKVAMTAFCCAAWTGIYYIMIGVVNFNRKNFIADAKEMSTMELMKSEGGLWGLLGSYIIIMIIVFRSRIGEKAVRRKK